jgi:hypothetical protein
MLYLGLALFLNAFHDLDYERDLSEFEPISRSACFAYAHDYGFDAIQTDDLWYYVSPHGSGVPEVQVRQPPEAAAERGMNGRSSNPGKAHEAA